MRDCSPNDWVHVYTNCEYPTSSPTWAQIRFISVSLTVQYNHSEEWRPKVLRVIHSFVLGILKRYREVFIYSLLANLNTQAVVNQTITSWLLDVHTSSFHQNISICTMEIITIGQMRLKSLSCGRRSLGLSKRIIDGLGRIKRVPLRAGHVRYGISP